jgi:ElaB/YqjD/DUF883 family membrane-anchored ribosome-binding protein
MSSSSFSQEMKNKSTEGKASAGSAANEVKGKAQELVSSMGQKLHDGTSDVSDNAQVLASDMARKAQETARAAVDKANDGIAAIGQRMSALSGTVRKAGPKDGVLGSAATTVADTLQVGGRYLEGHDLKDMGMDLTTMVKHYPIQSVLVSAGLGCLLGLMLRRS